MNTAVRDKLSRVGKKISTGCPKGPTKNWRLLVQDIFGLPVTQPTVSCQFLK